MKKNKKFLYTAIGAVILVLVISVFMIFIMKERVRDAAVYETCAIGKLRVCHLETPLGLDEENPVFSWQMTSGKRGCYQTSYRLIVAKSEEDLQNGTFCWDSNEVTQSESVGIAYAGEKLEPKTRYFWQVLVTDQDGKEHSSRISWFETGL